MFHTTYKMYLLALSLWLYGLLLLCIAFGMFCASGWPQGPTEVTGRLFQAASTAVFILMLLLLAKGYTVTRGRLTQMSVAKLVVFFCLYIIINVILFIWEGKFFDEGIVLYFYESPPGYGLITVRLFAWVWFVYAFGFTVKHHPDKASFYVPFFILYTVWFWAGPIVNLIAMMSAAKWIREQVVNGVDQFITLCGHLFFLILSRPFAANRNFPFHLRTNQVSFSEPDNFGSGDAYRVSEETIQHMETLFMTQVIHGDMPANNGAAAVHFAPQTMSMRRAPDGTSLRCRQQEGAPRQTALPSTFVSAGVMATIDKEPHGSLQQQQADLYVVTPGQRHDLLSSLTSEKQNGIGPASGCKPEVNIPSSSLSPPTAPEEKDSTY